MLVVADGDGRLDKLCLGVRYPDGVDCSLLPEHPTLAESIMDNLVVFARRHSIAFL